jgi:hypothetical protein
VLWGTDGTEVVCVQAGRIHAILGNVTAGELPGQLSAGVVVRPYETKAHTLPAVDIADLPSIQQKQCVGDACGIRRSPTPPAAGPPGAAPGGGGSMLPWRNEAEGRDNELKQRTDDLIRALEMERQARQAPPPVPPAAVATTPDPPRELAATFSPLLGCLIVLGAVAAGFVIYFASQKS